MFLLVFLISVVWSASLYGFIGNAMKSALVAIDSISGLDQQLGGNLLYEIPYGLGVYDAKKKVMYTLAKPHENDTVVLLGVATTGSVSCTLPLNEFAPDTELGLGHSIDLDPNSGDLFIMGESVLNSNKHVILRVNPTTGEKTKLLQLSGKSVPIAPSAFDYDKGLLYVHLELSGAGDDTTIHQIDVKGGKVVNKFRNSVLGFQTMHYDSKTGKIWGIGNHTTNSTNNGKEEEDEPYRTILSLDSTGKFEEGPQGDLKDGWQRMMGAVASFDARERKIYAIVQRWHYEPNEYYNMITVDIEDGSVGPELPPRCGPHASMCPFVYEIHA